MSQLCNLTVCAGIKAANKYNCVELAEKCPTEANEVDCIKWKRTAKSRRVERKIVKSKKRIRAKLEKVAAKRTYKRTFCALAWELFKADVCEIFFQKILSRKNSGRRLQEADWDVTHEFSSSKDVTPDTVQVTIQQNTFDRTLMLGLKQADATSFANTTVQDKGVVVVTETVTIYEVRSTDHTLLSVMNIYQKVVATVHM